MSEHKVTENITQTGEQRSAHLECSCGLSLDVADLRKLSLPAARRQLESMHKNLTAENSPKPKKEKKSKKQKLVIESTENDPEIDDPELPEAYQ